MFSGLLFTWNKGYCDVSDSDSDPDYFISPKGGNSGLQATHPLRVKVKKYMH